MMAMPTESTVAFAVAAPLRGRYKSVSVVRSRRTAPVKAIAAAPPSAAVHSALLLCATAANTGLLPPTHASYAAINRLAVPLSLPLLLCQADLRRIIRDTGKLLPLFLVAALATTVSTVLVVRLVPLPFASQQDVFKIAAALCARHIGGAINFAAVVDTLRPSEHLVAAVLAADNIVVAAYFALLLLLASNGKPSLKGRPQPQQQQQQHQHQQAQSTDADGMYNPPFNLEQLAISLSASSLIVFAAQMLNKLLPISPGPIPLITLCSILIATLFPSTTKPFHSASTSLGIFLTQLFFAVVGVSSGSIISVLRASPLILLFSFAHIAFHFILLTLAKFVLRLDFDLCLLVSNAAVGGPTTAAAMAVSKKWHHLVAPALLVGVFGYAVATFIALAMAHFVLV
ncbi:putative membrane protein YjcL [Gracilariopsis chorda]|uniref:Putative membrane protein YjcL n=1 Tax=Gracilariopsis chorda TaxID=448386 RepID=A0A2V3J5X3_9FLOR|nr:putative membrane protein YjcL [Gracilariopsis chorda]|eukprot:PXF49387.1 putative membrane protein YjcL [Gracilariopsis chorda]